MMKLIISLVLTVFVTISNGVMCTVSGVSFEVDNTGLSNKCGSITISGVKYSNGFVSSYNGDYNREDNGLFKKVGDEKYLSYWWGKDGQYVGVESGDVTCEGGLSGIGLQFAASELDNLRVNTEAEFVPIYPDTGDITVSCNTESNEQAPVPQTPAPVTPAPVTPLSANSLCYAVKSTSAAQNYAVRGAKAQGYIQLTTIAGQYKRMAEPDEFGKPVYELIGCDRNAYIAYVDNFELYMVVLDLDDLVNTYTTYCTNTEEVGNDPLQCKWTNSANYKITDDLESCSCGQTY